MRKCPGVGGRSCGIFMSPLTRDPHPTCYKCRGKKCTSDDACDVCISWSEEQWKEYRRKKPKKAKRDKDRAPSGTASAAPPAASLEVRGAGGGLIEVDDFFCFSWLLPCFGPVSRSRSGRRGALRGTAAPFRGFGCVRGWIQSHSSFGRWGTGVRPRIWHACTLSLAFGR